MADLSHISDAFADAAARAAGSTVLVDARARIPATGIAWAHGVVVTANHVVERETDITVGLPSGDAVAATLAGRDPGSDIAVLRVADDVLEPLSRAPEDTARVGHLVLALGRPTSHGHNASLGVVSAMGGPWRTVRGLTVASFLRADVTMYPGFSGGPLVDTSGQVLGMNSSALGRSGGLTIPLHAAQPIVDAILVHGGVRRGYLGISTQTVRLPASVAEAVDQGQETGLLVSAVEPGSPADAGGVFVGDIVVGTTAGVIACTEDLQSQLGPDSVGSEASFRVIRGGQVATLVLRVGERD